MNEQISTRPALANAGSNGPERIVYPASPRYRRIRSLSILMDQSIVLPSGYRIGLDPLLGLVPGVGDIVTALISLYLIYESARLGLAKRVLLRMLGNVTIEALAGAFPIVGDIFDAIWKANIRNLRLLDQHYNPAIPERPAHQIVLWMLAIAGSFVLVIGTLFYLIARMILSFLGAVFPFLQG